MSATVGYNFDDSDSDGVEVALLSADESSTQPPPPPTTTQNNKNERDESSHESSTARQAQGDGEEEDIIVNKTHGLGTASPFSCTVNLANTIVGAGMLGLPHAFSEAGSFVGVGAFSFSYTPTLSPDTTRSLSLFLSFQELVTLLHKPPDNTLSFSLSG